MSSFTCAAGEHPLSAAEYSKFRLGLIDSAYGRSIGDDPIYLWIAGLGRYASSRQWRLSRRRGYSLTLGQSITIAVLILFFAGQSLCADSARQRPSANQ